MSAETKRDSSVAAEREVSRQLRDGEDCSGRGLRPPWLQLDRAAADADLRRGHG